MISFDHSINSSFLLIRSIQIVKTLVRIFFFQKMTLASLWRLQDLVRLLSKGAGYNAED